MWLSPDSRRIASCSRLISSENTATVVPVVLAALTAMFMEMDVLPMPGREAMRMKSPGPKPRMYSSRSVSPEDRPVNFCSLFDASVI